MRLGDYPPGAANDPSAPYNQEPEIICPDCQGDGIILRDGEEGYCKTCDGNGLI